VPADAASGPVGFALGLSGIARYLIERTFGSSTVTIP
jgi:hypothetical protein